MAHRIKQDESVAHAVTRVVRDELDDALALARDPRAKVDERIHEVRLCLKRARAALALVGEEAGRPARRQARALRDLGRNLAAARDRAVAREALRTVSRRLAGAKGRPSKLVPRLRDALSRDGEDDQLADAARALAKAQRKVQRSLSRLDVGHERRTVSKGFERSFRRARRAHGAIQLADEAAPFHAWRKAIKRLRYQVQLIGDAAPLLLAAMEPLLERLGEELGELHDVTFLAGVVAEVGAARELQAERDRWLAHLDARAEVLRGQTRKLGASLFAEKPSAVRRRVAAGWARWRASSSPPA